MERTYSSTIELQPFFSKDRKASGKLIEWPHENIIWFKKIYKKYSYQTYRTMIKILASAIA